MGYYTFSASRISGEGNAIFPDEIIIDEEEQVVIYRKPRLIGSRETKIQFRSIASVSCSKHLLFADIYIETRGGREIASYGYSISDAEEITDLLSF